MKPRASYLVLPLAALLCPPALAFDCSKAKTAVEKAICGTVELKTLDDALATAYADVKAAVPPADQKMLARSQKRWIARREYCGEADEGVVACVMRETRERLSLLSGRPESGPGAAGKLVPQFIVQDGTLKTYDLNVAVLRFAAPKTLGEKALNAIAARELGRMKLGEHGEDTNGAIYGEDDIWSLTYASPSLISIRSDFFTNEGGAHGNYGVTNINLNMATGRELALGDVLTEPSAAILTLECRRQILTEKKRRLHEAGDDDPVTVDDAAVAEGVRSLAGWSIGEKDIVVTFNPDTIGPYAEGAYNCNLPTAGVKRLALPAAPLP